MTDTFDDYCMVASDEGYHCALPRGHPRDHYGGSPMLDEVEWVKWPVVRAGYREER